MLIASFADQSIDWLLRTLEYWHNIPNPDAGAIMMILALWAAIVAFMLLMLKYMK